MPARSNPFYLVSTISGELEPTNQQVIGLAKRYVGPDQNNELWFDWKGFQAAVNGYRGDDLLVSGANANTINQEEPDVPELIAKLEKYLKAVYAVTVDPTENATLSEAVETTFNNLTKTTEGNVTTSQGSSEWRFIASAPSPSGPDEFSVTVVSVKFEGLITEEKPRFGWHPKITKNFSASITSLKLDVTKGFVAPA
jgi:hypothetical protein